MEGILDIILGAVIGGGLLAIFMGGGNLFDQRKRAKGIRDEIAEGRSDNTESRRILDEIRKERAESQRLASEARDEVRSALDILRRIRERGPISDSQDDNSNGGSYYSYSGNDRRTDSVVPGPYLPEEIDD
jgi:hypothetical protein